MPSEPTAEQAEIRRKGRQRLVGAVVLALLAVVFVPMVLDPEPRRDRPEPALAIPDRNAAPVAAAPAPAAPEPARRPEQAAAPESKAAESPKSDDAARAEPAKAPETAVVKTVEPKAAEFKAAPKAAVVESKPAPAPKAEPAAAPRLEGFAVQVGAFREDAKLQQARDKLKAARVPHYTERIDAEGGALTRLRAGPYPTREAAEKALAAIKKAGVEGRVVPLP
jgi:DedD protein